MQAKGTLVGLVWYRRGDYRRILEVMEDASELQDTFDEWEHAAEQVERELAKGGIEVLRVLLRPETFKAWCVAEGRRCIAGSRSNWASGMAEQAELRGYRGKGPWAGDPAKLRAE